MICAYNSACLGRSNLESSKRSECATVLPVEMIDPRPSTDPHDLKSKNEDGERLPAVFASKHQMPNSSIHLSGVVVANGGRLRFGIGGIVMPVIAR